METLDLALIAVHVVAVVVWIGSLAAIGLVVSAPSGDDKTRGSIARRIYLKAAVPAFLLAFGAGLARLLRGWHESNVSSAGAVAGGYAKAHWMHAKLTAVLVVVALHHIVGARTRKMADNGASAGPAAMMVNVALLAAVAAIVFVVVRPF